jgi:hypothetical protein
MRSKIIIGVLMLASTLVILPAADFAATSEKTNSVTVNELSPQIRVRIGRGNRRNRGWNRGRLAGRTRLVRQVYYVRGHRYVRWVRVRY